MALSLDTEELDRGQHNVLDLLQDDDEIEHRLHSFPSAGTILDLPSSTLAGVDQATALRWQYEDKMVVMGLVLGCK